MARKAPSWAPQIRFESDNGERAAQRALSLFSSSERHPVVRLFRSPEIFFISYFLPSSPPPLPPTPSPTPSVEDHDHAPHRQGRQGPGQEGRLEVLGRPVLRPRPVSRFNFFVFPSTPAAAAKHSRKGKKKLTFRPLLLLLQKKKKLKTKNTPQQPLPRPVHLPARLPHRRVPRRLRLGHLGPLGRPGDLCPLPRDRGHPRPLGHARRARLRRPGDPQEQRRAVL